MDKKTFREQGYELYPKKNTESILALIISVIALYEFAERFNLYQSAVFYLIIALLIVIYFLVTAVRRVGTLAKEHNSLLSSYRELEDNRDTLSKMIDQKNNKIDHLNNRIPTLQAQTKLLLMLMYAEQKPKKNDLVESLGIDYEEDNNGD